MLKLLLDEHISPSVAYGLRRKNSALVIHSLAEWEGGAYLGRDDATCMENAAHAGLTLVTYDRRTIPPLLKSWSEHGKDHGGVVFVDEKTIPPSDLGALVRTLNSLAREAMYWDWKNRVCFLRR
jgi:hypothetical protein